MCFFLEHKSHESHESCKSLRPCGHPEGNIRAKRSMFIRVIREIRGLTINYTRISCFHLNTNSTNRTNLASRSALAAIRMGTY